MRTERRGRENAISARNGRGWRRERSGRARRGEPGARGACAGRAVRDGHSDAGAREEPGVRRSGGGRADGNPPAAAGARGACAGRAVRSGHSDAGARDAGRGASVRARCACGGGLHPEQRGYPRAAGAGEVDRSARRERRPRRDARRPARRKPDRRPEGSRPGPDSERMKHERSWLAPARLSGRGAGSRRSLWRFFSIRMMRGGGKSGGPARSAISGKNISGPAASHPPLGTGAPPTGATLSLTCLTGGSGNGK